MEEEKLLFILKIFWQKAASVLGNTLIILLTLLVFKDVSAVELNQENGAQEKGLESYNFKAEDEEFANEMRVKAQQINRVALQEKLLELQKMQSSVLSKTNDAESVNAMMQDSIMDNNNILRVFVSSSMPLELLKHYATQAKYYKAILVFKGLPNGSWIQLANLIHDIVGTEIGNQDIAIQIDDESFALYGINSVPSFVFSREGGMFAKSSDGEADSKTSSSSSNIVFDKVVGNIGIKRALEEIAAEGELSEVARELLHREHVQ